MTLAEQWKNEGIQIGIQQGLQQGVQKGTLEGERSILKKQLMWRFLLMPEKYLDTIDNASIEQLEFFAKKFLEAKTLEDVFGNHH
jgi:flagellar biosynthesis/type III secretory pathway protein FliH